MSIRFKKLLNLYLEQTATNQEKEQFFDMLSSGAYDEFVLDSLDDAIKDDLGAPISVYKNRPAVNKNIISSYFPFTVLRFKPVVKWAIAALIIVSGFFFINRLGLVRNSRVVFENKFIQEHAFKETNLGKGNKRISLPDGSIVTLQHNASLYYSKKSYLTNRAVLLKGEGGFYIAKDKHKPFRVYCGDIVTHVLGTSFKIKKNRSGNVEVEVLTGKVKIYRNEQLEHIDEVLAHTLTPNQKIIYSDVSHSFTKGLVDAPILVIKEADMAMVENQHANLFHFKNTPLNEIFKTLQTSYSIEFQVQSDQIKNCVFSGNLTNTELFDQLKIICLATNLTYQVNETSIVISGGGCKL